MVAEVVMEEALGLPVAVTVVVRVPVTVAVALPAGVGEEIDEVTVLEETRVESVIRTTCGTSETPAPNHPGKVAPARPNVGPRRTRRTRQRA